MSFFDTKRAYIRTLSFLCAALAVSAVACPMAEYSRVRAENAETELLVCGIDALTGAVCGIAEGEAALSHVRTADTALMLLPLDSGTAASVAGFIEAALNTPEDSSERELVTSYAKSLYGRLRCICDRIASEDLAPDDAAALLSSLRLSLPLPTSSLPFSEADGSEEFFGLLENAAEVSEGEARDTAAEVIGSGITLRLNASNRTHPEVYSFYCSNAYADVTKYGGYLLRYSLALVPDAAVLSVEDALVKLDRFIVDRGYAAFELCEYSENGGILRASYIKRGSDAENSPKIKAGIALDTGKVCYFDAYEFMKYS